MTDLDQNLDVRRFFAFGGRGCRKERFLGSAALLTLLFGCGKAPAEADAAQTPQEVACGLTNSKADAYTKLFLSFIFDKTHTRYLPMNGVGLSEVPPKIMSEADLNYYEASRQVAIRIEKMSHGIKTPATDGAMFSWDKVSGVYVVPKDHGENIMFINEFGVNPRYKLDLVRIRHKSTPSGFDYIPNEPIVFFGLSEAKKGDVENFVHRLVASNKNSKPNRRISLEKYEDLCAIGVAIDEEKPVKVVAGFDAGSADARNVLGNKTMSACMVRARLVTLGLPLVKFSQIYEALIPGTMFRTGNLTWSKEWFLMLSVVGRDGRLANISGGKYEDVCPIVRDYNREVFSK